MLGASMTTTTRRPTAWSARLSLAPLGLALLLAGPAPARDAQLEGPLPAPARLRVGDFVVDWTPRGGGALSVRHTAALDREAWGSRPGRGFVAARRSDLELPGQRGFFRVEERVRERLDRQTVDRVRAEGAGVVVEGRLLAPGAPTSVGVAGVLAGRAGAPGGADPANAPGYRLLLEAVAPSALRVTLSLASGAGATAVELVGASDPDERFLGFGMQFTHLDLKGRRVPILVQEQGIGRGLQPVTALLHLAGGAGGDWSTTYAPVPHYLTTRLRSLCLEDSAPSFFDLTDPGAARVEVLAPRLRARIFHGASPLALIEAYTAYAGRMRPLPDWAHAGLIVGATGGTDRTRALADALDRHGVPVTAFFLQDWVGERDTPFGTRLWWDWQPDAGTYADWPGFVRELRGRGHRVLGYVNPFLVEGRPGAPRDLWGEARRGGHLVPGADGRPVRIGQGGFDAGLVDLTAPGARDWLKALLRDELLGSGMSGWMGDFGEALPFDARPAGGSARALHNRWPELWQSLQAEVVAEAGLADEVLYFSRSGYTTSPGRTRLFWLGDQLCSWDRHDGLASALTGLLSSGISGFSLNHGDAGGYTNLRLGPFVFFRRTKELLLRWLEFAAFTPVLRTHEGLVPGARGGHGLDTDADTLDQVARITRIFRALQPYRRALMAEAAARGWPLVRHPWLHHPEQVELLRERGTFLLGPDLLVAPVIAPGRREVEVRLPPGRWVHVWTDQVVGDPGRTTVARLPAPLGRPAALHREGSAAGEAFVRALAAEGLRAPR